MRVAVMFCFACVFPFRVRLCSENLSADDTVVCVCRWQCSFEVLFVLLFTSARVCFLFESFCSCVQLFGVRACVCVCACVRACVRAVLF